MNLSIKPIWRGLRRYYAITTDNGTTLEAYTSELVAYVELATYRAAQEHFISKRAASHAAPCINHA